jgi:hypothetical protein
MDGELHKAVGAELDFRQWRDAAAGYTQGAWAGRLQVVVFMASGSVDLAKLQEASPRVSVDFDRDFRGLGRPGDSEGGRLEIPRQAVQHAVEPLAEGVDFKERVPRGDGVHDNGLFWLF